MNRPLLALLTAGLLATGCTRAPPPSRSAAAASAACRAQSEAAYNRQNRALLSTRDTTDTPFSTSGVSGITTNGLSREYDREVNLDKCLRGAGGADAASGDGTAFQGPVVQQPNAPGE
jgi:hypothetical protein